MYIYIHSYLYQYIYISVDIYTVQMLTDESIALWPHDTASYTLQHTATRHRLVHTTTHCNVLQRTADTETHTHCNTYPRCNTYTHTLQKLQHIHAHTATGAL